MSVKRSKVALLGTYVISFFQASLTISCLVCVLWQSCLCFSKFLSKPSATSLYYKSIGTLPQPAFTFCRIFQVEDCIYPSFNLYEYNKNRSYCEWSDLSIPGFKPSQSFNLEKSINFHTLVPKIHGWKISQENWERILKKDKFKMSDTSVMPLSHDKIAVCYTTSIPSLEVYSLVGLSNSGYYKNLLYIHSNQQLFEPSRTNDWFEVDGSRKETFMADLAYNKLVSTPDIPCTQKTYSFDTCISDFAYQRMMDFANCSLFFLDPDSETVCRNFSSAQLAMKGYMTAFWDNNMRANLCKLPCNFFTAQIKYQKIDNVLGLFSGCQYKYRRSKYTQAMLKIKPKVLVMETTYSYSLVQLVAEVGGWLSLFLGFSFPLLVDKVLHVVTIASHQIRKQLNLTRGVHQLSKLIKLLVYLVCSFIVLLELSVCSDRYQRYPVSTAMFLSNFDTAEKPSISFCLPKAICQLDSDQRNIQGRFHCGLEYGAHYLEANNSFKENHNQFWKQGTRVEDMLTTVEVPDQSDAKKWKTIWNNELGGQLSSKVTFNASFVPQEQEVLFFCHTLNLDQLLRVSSLKFGIKADVQLSIHHKGQISSIFTNERPAFNIKNAYEFVKDNKIVHQDTTYSLKLAYNSLELNTPENLVTGYDKCVQEVILMSTVRTKSCLLPPQFGKIKPGLEPCKNASAEAASLKNFFTSYLNQLNIEPYCKTPSTFIDTKFLKTDEKSRRGSKKRKTFFFVKLFLPRFVKNLVAYRAYTFANAVAEFGSYMGLFLGICCLDATKEISKVFSNSAHAKFIKKFGRALHMLFSVVCVLSVGFQSAVCISKYKSKPLATKVFYDKYTSMPPVHFTVCQLLYKDLIVNRMYHGQQLQVGFNLSQLIDRKVLHNISYYDLTQNTWELAMSSESLKIAKYFLSPRYSEKLYYICQSLDMSGLGHHKLKLIFKPSSTTHLFLHNRGQFFDDSLASHIKVGKKEMASIYSVQLQHIKLVSSEILVCQQGSKQTLDHCLVEFGKETMLESIGCFPPIFGHEKEHVCPNKTLALQSLKEYHRALSANYAEKRCQVPCELSELSVRLETIDQSNELATYTIKLPKVVKVTQTFNYYLFTSFVAELGGWVGLFIGIYILQLNHVVEQIKKLLLPASCSSNKS